MLKRIPTSIIALIFLIQISVAQGLETSQAPGGWNVVESLTNGERLDIELKSGKRIKGKLVSVSKTDLSISAGGKTTTLSRDDVLRVYQVIGRTRGKSALRGAGIGGAIGVGSGLIVYLPNREDIVGWVVPAFGVLGAGIGAGVGAAFGSGRKRVLIYQAG